MAIHALPEYVVTNVLSWLPVKSVIRFKCVCKSWCTLMGKSSFITEHLNHTMKKHNSGILVKSCLHMEDKDTFFLLSDHTFDLFTNVDLSYLNDDWRVDLEMLVACNGIICLHNKRSRDVALWNPATREFKALPISCISCPLGLRFNSNEIAFGFDVKTNDYKVVRIIFFGNDGGQPLTHQVEIYHLSTDSWRPICTIMPVHYIVPNPLPNTYLDGTCYWCAKHNINDEKLLSFDMSDEVFGIRALPNVCTLSSCASYQKVFAVLRETISLILFPRTTVKCFDIWVLNRYDDEESWTKLYTIGPISGDAWPLGFSKDGKLFLESHKELILYDNGEFVFEEDAQLVLCNPVTQEIMILQVEGESGSLEVLVYMESLVSIQGGNCRTHRSS